MEIHAPIIILAWQLGQSPLFFLDFQLLWDRKTSSELIPTKARIEPRTHPVQTTCCRISSREPTDQTFIWQTYKLTKPTDHFASKHLSTYSPEEKNLKKKQKKTPSQTQHGPDPHIAHHHSKTQASPNLGTFGLVCAIFDEARLFDDLLLSFIVGGLLHCFSFLRQLGLILRVVENIQVVWSKQNPEDGQVKYHEHTVLGWGFGVRCVVGVAVEGWEEEVCVCWGGAGGEDVQ